MANPISRLAKLPLLFALAAPGSAWASQVLFSNFGPGQSYDQSLALSVGNDFAGDNLAQAGAFTPSSSAQIGAILIALSEGLGQSDPVTVAVAQDNNGLPGATLESFSIGGGSLAAMGGGGIVTLSSLLNPMLVAGTQYWVTVSTTLNNSIGWHHNDGSNDSASNLEAYSLDGGINYFAPAGNARGAFEIDALLAQAAPEPGMLALLAGGALGMAGRRKRRR